MKAVVLSLLLLTTLVGVAAADDSSSLEFYGFVMMDAGYNVDQIHPNWFDTMRVTKLPAFDNQYGSDGNTFFSVRQTRFGVRGTLPTDLGDMKTLFEWELFGVGVDEGQTTIRLRHAYGELGKVGAGQYWSLFMDIDVFPNTLEYWGPTGMVFFRNVQLRFMPIQGDTRMTIALERPGASGDAGIYADRVELTGIQPRFPLPDLSAEYRSGHGWGYFELAGILRRIEWDDQLDDAVDLSGNVTGWGVNLSTNIKFRESDTFRGQVVYGEGIENYMNDSPVDVAIDNVSTSPTAPVDVKALPITGVVAFLDHTWSPKYSTSVGYSMQNIDNAGGQLPGDFHAAQYAIGNLLYYPAPNVMCGLELQWGQRENIDGFKSDATKIQVSFKYNFSKTLM